MNWEALLSTQKLGNDEKEPEEFSRYPMNEFEKVITKLSPALHSAGCRTKRRSFRWIKATLSGPG